MGVLNLAVETTARVLAERRQAFRLALEDRLRDLANPDEIIAVASEALGQHLNAGQVAYAELEPNGEFVTIAREWNDGTIPNIAGRHRLDDFGPTFVADLRRGRTVDIGDVRLDPRTSTPDALASFASLSLAGFINAPVIKQGRLVAILAVHNATCAHGLLTRLPWLKTSPSVPGRRPSERAPRRDCAMRKSATSPCSTRIDQGFCTIEVAFDEHDVPVDYRFLEVSPSFERQTGIENGAGRWMREIAPDQDQFWFDTYGRVALTGEPARFENYSTPLGRWWDVYAFRISGPRRIAVLFRDITDQKRAEAALRESEARFRHMADSAPALIWMSDEEGRVIDLSAAADGVHTIAVRNADRGRKPEHLDPRQPTTSTASHPAPPPSRAHRRPRT